MVGLLPQCGVHCGIYSGKGIEMSEKPLPRVMTWDQGFWENAERGVLSAQHCGQCGNLQFYPRVVCVKCFSTDLGWQPLSGKGRVHSFTIVRYPANPVFKDDTPIIFAEIELEEGIRIHSDITRCSPEEVTMGIPVRVEFSPTASEKIHLPHFVLTETP